MPFKLRKTIPEKLRDQICKWEDIHGTHLFEQRLYQTVQQNSEVQNVHIKSQDQSQNSYMDIYKNIEEWSIQQYNLPENFLKCEWTFHILSGIKFTELQILNIQGCQISSVQPLAWLQAPNLQRIDFTNNRIVSVKPLTKASLPNLYMGINLTQNPISQFEYIHTYDIIIRLNNDTQEFIQTLSMMRHIKVAGQQNTQ